MTSSQKGSQTASQTASQASVHAARAQHRISRLAAALPVHRAFHWLHLYQSQLRLWQLEMLAIPAPPFAEQARAAWFLQRFHDLGLSNVHLDAAGNALGELSPEPESRTPFMAPLYGDMSGSAPELNATQNFVLVSAHLDTVFPASADTRPSEDGPRILGPGACDNAAGLTALLALVAALRYAGISPPAPILFAANVGEEGEGDLRGMRHLFLDGAYRGRIAAALALEGSGTGVAVTRALGSRRFRVTVNGPGGHSWTDAGAPNPITLLSRAIVAIANLPLLQPKPGAETTTFSPGVISGGTSVNSIPESASVLIDLRSTQQAALDTMVQSLPEILASLIHPPAGFLIESVGDRPAAALPETSPLLQTLRAVDRHLGIRTELRLGSTDANIPLSLGIPAAALASGGTGGGIHTLAEWFDPTGRETALRRLLLTLLDLAQNLHHPVNLLP
jgi:acetylornithine deacetylase/succinyl-diaminopimelate desuccinylase-like protein